MVSYITYHLSLRHLSATELCHHLLVLEGGTVLQLVLSLFPVLFPELCHHVLVLEAHEVYLADDTMCHGRLVLVCCVGIWVRYSDPVQLFPIFPDK